MPYVDGFVLAVPKSKLDQYKKMARKAGKIWMEHGALSYVECVADDLQDGAETSFTKAVKQKRGETVVFAWITYKSRRDRDAVNKRVLSDPRVLKQMETTKSPFDENRMIYGGFKTMIDL